MPVRRRRHSWNGVLGNYKVGIFTNVRPHVPIEVAEVARECAPLSGRHGGVVSTVRTSTSETVIEADEGCTGYLAHLFGKSRI